MARRNLVRPGWVLLTLLVLLSLMLPQVAYAQSAVHVVRRGENLTRIAQRYGTTVQAIVALNGLKNANFVWVGQRLRIPSGGSSTRGGGGTSASSTVHVVRRGENLSMLARRYGTSVSALVQANSLRNANYIWVGQRLRIPRASGGGTAPVSGGGARWIDVDLSSQTVLARVGDQIVRRMLVSTGLARTPTPVGRYRVYSKYRSVNMSGPGYYLPNVPHTMFFYGSYALHGTYWHSNFGHPMSHGCINLTKADASWLYQWTATGTLVVIHW